MTTSPLEEPPPAVLADLARPVQHVDAQLPCARVDELFRADEALDCLVVRGSGRRSATGLVTRLRFQQQMAGRFGYGRAVHARHPVSALADFDPLVLAADTPLAVVAQRVVERSAASRFSEVLALRADGSLAQVAVAAVFRALADEYAAEARTDDLTGLANRSHFLARLGAACAQEPGARLAVLYLDLDGFKAVNDAYGHAVGDDVLAVVARRLRSCFRAHDLVARLGGDEFAVLMTAPADEGVAAERWREVVAQAGERAVAALRDPVVVGDLVLAGRVSTGVAVATGPVEPATLLRESDLAMYRAKRSGGARAVEVHVDAAAPAEHDVPDRGRLRRALAAGEFRVVYQPITEVRSGAIASVEALVRWAHPQRGLLGPGQFLDAVHGAGLGLDLDLEVLRRAGEQLVAWSAVHGGQAPPFLNVNLSLDSVLAPDLAGRVLAVVDGTGLDPVRLRLELPESATTEQVRQASGELELLRAAGINLTLDDLGAGASTLHHLTALRFDGVKIDQRFVAGMLDDERDAAVVATLIDLGSSVAAAVTAEGVETPQQLEALRELAGDRRLFVQGYLVSRPVAPEALPLPWPAGVLPVAAAVAVLAATAAG